MNIVHTPNDKKYMGGEGRPWLDFYSLLSHPSFLFVASLFLYCIVLYRIVCSIFLVLSLILQPPTCLYGCFLFSLFGRYASEASNSLSFRISHLYISPLHSSCFCVCALCNQDLEISAPAAVY